MILKLNSLFTHQPPRARSGVRKEKDGYYKRNNKIKNPKRKKKYIGISWESNEKRNFFLNKSKEETKKSLKK